MAYEWSAKGVSKMTLRKMLNLYKGNTSGIIAGVALLISLGSLWATYGELSLHKDNMRYTFWKHINSSMEIQERTVSIAYSRAMKEEGVGYAVLGNIHERRLDCKGLAKVMAHAHEYSIEKMDTEESSSDSALIAEYGAAVLENRPLVGELRIAGWTRFVKAEGFSDKWWNNLAGNAMHIQFLSGIWGWRCSTKSMRPIRVSTSSLRLLKQALAITQRDATDIEVYGGPSIMAIQNLESENESGRRATWNIRKQLGHVGSDLTHKVGQSRAIPSAGK